MSATAAAAAMTAAAPPPALSAGEVWTEEAVGFLLALVYVGRRNC